MPGSRTSMCRRQSFRLWFFLAAALMGVLPAQSALAQKSVTTQSIDPFGQETKLAARPILYVAGSGTWDKAYDTLTEAFKKVSAYMSSIGLKAAGPAMTIYTATDDTGFDFKAAIPLTEPPKTPPAQDVKVGQSPEGRALKFVHRGTYDELNQTYEAITNYLDEKGLDAQDVLIEEYLPELGTTPDSKLVVNVFVPLK